MKAAEVVIDALERVEGDVERLLKDLDEEDLRWQPAPESNPIGWLVWHLTRVQDIQISNLAGRSQAWIEEGWAETFGREANPRDMGYGKTPAEVASFAPPSAETLLAYYRAVLARSKQYLAGLSDEDLDRVLNEPRWNPMPTVGVRLVSTIDDCAKHAAEAAYVRGIRQGIGWQKH